MLAGRYLKKREERREKKEREREKKKKSRAAWEVSRGNSISEIVLSAVSAKRRSEL